MTINTLRWQRNQHPETLVLQPRDKEIMVALYAFRFLTREQIQRLFGFSCLRRANMRLRKLYDHQYVCRRFLPTTRGSGQALYYLGKEGVSVVAQELGLDPLLVKQKAREIARLKPLFLDHGLELNDLRITICQAIGDHPQMSLERWVSEDQCQQEYRGLTGGQRVLRKFRPDGYFRVCYQDRLYSFFLELDRSTMSNRRFRSKAATYVEFRRLGLYQKRFGVKTFRVLVVVTSTSERLANLKKAVEEVTGEMFWFTTMKHLSQATVFAPIWQKAGERGLFPLLPGEVSK